MKIPALLSAVAAVATAATLAAVPVAPAQAADVTIKPAALPRGVDFRLPHVEGTQVVEGARRVDVPGTYASYKTTFGRDYLVTSEVPASWGENETETHLWRVGDHTPVDLGVEHPFGGDVVVAGSPDLKRILVIYPYRTDNFWVRDVATGRTVRHGEVDPYSTLLGFDGQRAWFGLGNRLVRWNADTGRYVTLDRRDAQVADLAGDRVALTDARGCAEVTSLRKPGRASWRSCTERVEAFAPGGRRMVTRAVRDGRPEPRRWLRTTGGRELASYRAQRFGYDVTFENRRTFLMTARGTQARALVRCTATRCERAGRLVRTQG